MDGNRAFTAEELRGMEARTLDLLQAAIAAGDKDLARQLAQRMQEEFNFLHDGYMFWVAGLQTYIYDNHGIDELEAAERLSHTIEMNTVFKTSGEKPDFRERIKFAAKAMRGHMQPIEIKEDDEKVVITMKPCGSGERIIEKGGYEAGLATVKERHAITYGFENMPVYCVHCPAVELLMVEGTGELDMVRLIKEDRKHGFCHFGFYKNPKNIPEELYTRIGKTKPTYD